MQSSTFLFQRFAVNKVEIKIKILNSQLTSRGDTHCSDELSEVDETVGIRIECSEDMLGKGLGVTVRKTFLVDLLELVYR